MISHNCPSPKTINRRKASTIRPVLLIASSMPLLIQYRNLAHHIAIAFLLTTHNSRLTGRLSQHLIWDKCMDSHRNRSLTVFIKPHSLYSQPVIDGISQLDSTTNKMAQRLRFAPLSDPLAHEYEAISLPKIEPFVPSGTDPDSAGALSALYRSHCTSLIECIRFCKEKTFFHLFTSFHGTLTMPVQKLFSNPSIAPWIEECDFIMYQKMMRVVAPLNSSSCTKASIRHAEKHF